MNNNMFAKAAIWMVIALVLFTVFKQFESRQKPSENVSYTQFMDQAKAGQIKRVDVQGRNLNVTPVEGNRYTLTSPGDLWMVDDLRKATRAVAGVQVFLAPVQNLQLGGRQSKSRYQYTLQSVSGGEIGGWAENFLERMRADERFRDVNSDSQNKALQATVDIDRDKAALLGVQMADIRTVMYASFGERQVSTIYTPVDSYQVIMEVAPGAKQDESAFNNIYVRSSNGGLVPLSSFATVQRSIGPTSINNVGQLQAVTVSFNLAPGTALGDATAKIEKYRDQIRLPASIITSYGGDAAVFKSSQGSQAILIVSALCERPLRFNALRRRIEGVTQKALTQALRRLERNGMVERAVIASSPVAVEYRSTALGRSLKEPLAALHAWAVAHGEEVMAARAAFDGAARPQAA